MQPETRRAALRALCGCTLAAGGGRLFAQVLPSGALARSPADTWRGAGAHIERAIGMSASVTASLDTLTREVARILESIEQLKRKAGSLSGEIPKLKDRRQSLLEEYRNGLFCSGCSQTKSQILAKGEKFPHPGQKIIQPTPEQIKAKDRELQLPIDDAVRQLGQVEKDLKKNQDQSLAGLEQVRLGVLFWRTASSYARLSQAAGAELSLKQLEQQAKDMEASLAASRQLVRTARTEPERENARREVESWQRLLAKNKSDAKALQGRIGTSSTRVSDRVGSEFRRIQGFVNRGELFARVGGPSEVLVFPSAPEFAMGATYLMGRLPDPGVPPSPLPSVRGFASSYQQFGGEFGQARSVLSAAPAAPATAPASPAPAAAPAPAAPSSLLKALP